MILNEFFNSNQTESLADDFMKMAREKGYNPTLRTGPQPTKPAGAATADSGAIDRSAVQAEFDQLQKQFDPDYQYSDDYTFWSKQNRIAQRMSVLKKLLANDEKGVAEGVADMHSNELLNTVRGAIRKAIKETGDQSLSKIFVCLRDARPASEALKNITSPNSLAEVDNALQEVGIDFDDLLDFINKQAEKYGGQGVAESK